MADNQAQPQFRKEATPVLEEYRAKVRQAFGQIAGRGFLAAPGFLFEAQSMIEYEAKRRLSEINYNILAAQIELELKQAGMTYDLAHKNALMDWETRKQGLFSDWEKELAYMKRDMAFEENELEALAREVARRGILLQEAQNAIALEKETVREQLEQLGGETADHEVALANARVLTAEKKLEVIPYLEQLVALEEQMVEKEWGLIGKNQILMGKNETLLEKEQELQAKINQVVQKSFEVLSANEAVLGKDWDILAKQEEKAPYTEELIEKETTLAEKRRVELGPAIAALVEVYERYAQELDIQTEIYKQIADVKTETAGIEEQRLEKLDVILEKQMELNEVTGLLAEGQLELAQHQVKVLLPAIGRLAEAYERLLGEIEKQVELKAEAMGIRKETTLLGVDRADKEIEESAARLKTEEWRQKLEDARHARQEQGRLIDQALQQLNLDSIRDLMEAENMALDTELGKREEVHSEEQGSELSLFQKALGRALDSVQSRKLAERTRVREVSREDRRRVEEVAALNAAPKITAQLEHLLTM